MALFAELSDENIVTNVVVINDFDLNNLAFPESEQAAIDFYSVVLGNPTAKIKQTDRNGAFRKNYASMGGTYDPENDVFISKKPYPSWTLNPETFKWTPPTPRPDEDWVYNWDESTLSWIRVEGYY